MFKGRHFDRSVILLCVRWYLAYGLSLRNLEEMMAERGISVDHATIHRWVIRYSPELLKRFNSRKRAVTGKWHVDETYIKVRGRWMYLYRAIDSHGERTTGTVLGAAAGALLGREVARSRSKGRRSRVAGKRMRLRPTKTHVRATAILIEASTEKRSKPTGRRCVSIRII